MMDAVNNGFTNRPHVHLYPAGHLFLPAGNDAEGVAGHAAPFDLNFSFDELPVTFNGIPVHKNPRIV